jgi:hypothetical protein
VRERPSDLSAAARARWLAELAEALAQAQRLAWHLADALGEGSGAMDLYVHIEEAISEVQSLRLGSFRQLPGKEDPEWMNSSPWPRNSGASSD